MRLVAIGAAAVLILLGYVLWDATRDETPHTAADSRPASAAGPHTTAGGAGPALEHATPDARLTPMPAEVWDANPGEIPRHSDAFWDRVDEYPRIRLMAFVADCYKGGQPPKAKLKVTYRLAIRSHIVTMEDVRVVESTLTDPALADCMVRALAAAKFQDDEMPDFESSAEDPEDMLIRIEVLTRRFPPKKPRP